MIRHQPVALLPALLSEIIRTLIPLLSLSLSVLYHRLNGIHKLLTRMAMKWKGIR